MRQVKFMGLPEALDSHKQIGTKDGVLNQFFDEQTHYFDFWAKSFDKWTVKKVFFRYFFGI